MKPALLWPAAGAALLLALGWAASAGLAPTSFRRDVNGDAAIQASLERLAQQQDAIAARLERLETVSPRGGGPTVDGSRVVAPGPYAKTAGRPGGVNGAAFPLDQQASTAESLRKLDDALVKEPLDAFWARNTEGRIAQLLDDRALARLKLPAPVSLQSTCHSQTCRIDMLYDNEMDAEQTSLHLYEEIANNLPHAETFYLPGPNGTTKMVVYASGGG